MEPRVPETPESGTLAQRIASPLTLAGLALSVLSGLCQLLVRSEALSTLTEAHRFALLQASLRYVFATAVLSLILGLAAHAYARASHASSSRVTQRHSGSGDNVAGDKLVGVDRRVTRDDAKR